MNENLNPNGYSFVFYPHSIVYLSFLRQILHSSISLQGIHGIQKHRQMHIIPKGHLQCIKRENSICVSRLYGHPRGCGSETLLRVGHVKV